MADHYGLASKFNDAGNLDQAATHFALAAFELMVTKKFEDTKTVSLGAAELLQAISCDVRVNNTDRAVHLFDFTKNVPAHGMPPSAAQALRRRLVIRGSR